MTASPTSPANSTLPAFEQSSWDLSELLPQTTAYATSMAMEGKLLELEDLTNRLEERRPELNAEMTSATLLDFLRLYEELLEKINIVEGYGHLWFSSDTQSNEALSYRNRVTQLVTDLDNRTLFFGLWWKSLSDEEANRLLPQGEDGLTSDYRHYLENGRRWKPFTLDEMAEQVVNLKHANGVEGLVTLYSILTNRLEFNFESDGEKQTLTRDQLMGHVYSNDPEKRAAAYQELYRVFGKEATVLGQIYTYRVRDWYNETISLRGFSSPIAYRNLQNDVPDEAVDTLLEVVQEQRGLFQRFFRKKAQWLGVEKLRRYDIYAPISEGGKEISWDQAVQEVLTTFEDFHPQIGELAKRVFEQKHIDSEVRKGKRGGAFCSTIGPKLTPWVLVNFTGRARDVAEIAHELGHAVHSMLADQHSLLTQHPCLPLAETASVFSEMLVTERLLERESDPLARRELLAHAISDLYATVMRQAYFVLFEREAHDAILAGRSLEDLQELYLENLAEQFGDSVEVSPEFCNEWVSIPHIFHTPFYCYAYSFGQLLVLSLFRRYQEEGEAFIPIYLKMLSIGGSAPTAAVLEEAGVDMTDPDFWRGGFAVIENLLEELERLPL